MTGLRTVVVRPEVAPELVAARLDVARAYLDGFTPVAWIGRSWGAEPVGDREAWVWQNPCDLWLTDGRKASWLRVGRRGTVDVTTLLENGAGVGTAFADDVPAGQRLWGAWPEGGWHADVVTSDDLWAEHVARVERVSALEGAPVWACEGSGRKGAGLVHAWLDHMENRTALAAAAERSPAAWFEATDPVIFGLVEASRKKRALAFATLRLPPDAPVRWSDRSMLSTYREAYGLIERVLTRDEATACLDRLVAAHPTAPSAAPALRKTLLDHFSTHTG